MSFVKVLNLGIFEFNVLNILKTNLVIGSAGHMAAKF